MQTSAHPSLTAPICKDCKHIAPGSHCLHPSQLIERDLINGAVFGPGCRKARADNGLCGPAGKLFEPRLRRRPYSRDFVLCDLPPGADKDAAQHATSRPNTPRESAFIGTTNETSFDRLPEFQPATLRCMTPVDPLTRRFGIAFNTDDGEAVRFKLLIEDAKWIRQWLADELNGYRESRT